MLKMYARRKPRPERKPQSTEAVNKPGKRRTRKPIELLKAIIDPPDINEDVTTLAASLRQEIIEVLKQNDPSRRRSPPRGVLLLDKDEKNRVCIGWSLCDGIDRFDREFSENVARERMKPLSEIKWFLTPEEQEVYDKLTAEGKKHADRRVHFSHIPNSLFTQIGRLIEMARHTKEYREAIYLSDPQHDVPDVIEDAVRKPLTYDNAINHESGDLLQSGS